MNKNKWFLNGGRGSGRSFRLLCETYENKIANLQHTVDTLQGYLDHDIEYDMDKTIQEQKIKIADLEKGNAELKEALKGKRCNCMTYFNFKDLEKELEAKEKQIEKMKNCKNCANYMISGKCPCFFRTGWCKNWEMAKGVKND